MNWEFTCTLRVKIRFLKLLCRIFPARRHFLFIAMFFRSGCGAVVTVCAAYRGLISRGLGRIGPRQSVPGLACPGNFAGWMWRSSGRHRGRHQGQVSSAMRQFAMFFQMNYDVLSLLDQPNPLESNLLDQVNSSFLFVSKRKAEKEMWNHLLWFEMYYSHQIKTELKGSSN